MTAVVPSTYLPAHPKIKKQQPIRYMFSESAYTYLQIVFCSMYVNIPELPYICPMDLNILYIRGLLQHVTVVFNLRHTEDC